MPPPRVRFVPVFLDLASLLSGNLQKLETIEQPEFVADFGLHWRACYRIKLRYLANEEQSVHHRRDSAFADFDADPGHDRTTWTTDGDRLCLSYSFAERAGRILNCVMTWGFSGRAGRYKPSVFHSDPTRAWVASSIRISSGHGRVKPSVAHFRVASMPIFDP